MRRLQWTFTTLLLCTFWAAMNIVVQTWADRRGTIDSTVDADEQVVGFTDCRIIYADFREDVPEDDAVVQLTVADVHPTSHRIRTAGFARISAKAEVTRTAANLHHDGFSIRPERLACADGN